MPDNMIPKKSILIHLHPALVLTNKSSGVVR